MLNITSNNVIDRETNRVDGVLGGIGFDLQSLSPTHPVLHALCFRWHPQLESEKTSLGQGYPERHESASSAKPNHSEATAAKAATVSMKPMWLNRWTPQLG